MLGNLHELVNKSLSCALFLDFGMSHAHQTFKVNLHGCDGSSPYVELSATIGNGRRKIKLPLPVDKYADNDQVWVSDRHRDKWFVDLM